MDKLRLLETSLRAFDTRLPAVAPWRCVRTRYRASSCRRCEDVCPHDAIVTSPWLTVDADRCSSCGACAAVCHTGALAYAEWGAGLREWLAAAAGDDGAALAACVRASHEAGDATAVPCAGGLSAADLIGAAAAGSEEMLVVTGACAGCTESAAACGLPRAIGAARRAVALLAPARSFSVRLIATPSAPLDGHAHAGERPQALSRRDLFAFVGRRARRATAETLVPAKPSIEDLHRQTTPPQSHVWLVRDLLGLASVGTDREAVLPDSLPLAEVVARPDCDGCGLCERYCPHGALASTADGLRQDPLTCVACGLCVEVCPREALDLRPLPLATLRAAAREAQDAQPPGLIRRRPQQPPCFAAPHGRR